jgi:hypothetical protein
VEAFENYLVAERLQPPNEIELQPAAMKLIEVVGT